MKQEIQLPYGFSQLNDIIAASGRRKTKKNSVQRTENGFRLLSVSSWIASLFLVIAALGITSSGAMAQDTGIVSEQYARTAGLVRSWFNQITMDVNQDRIGSVTLQDRTLFVTTRNGILTTIDAENGKTLWTKKMEGGEGVYFQPAAANSKIVAVVYGTTLYLFDRFNGKKLAQSYVFGQPSSGPQINERYVYIPLLSEKIFAFPLIESFGDSPVLESSLAKMNDVRKTVKFSKEIEDQITKLSEEAKSVPYRLAPLDSTTSTSCPSLGIPFVQPTRCSQQLDDDYICWVTHLGWLIIGQMKMNQDNPFDLLYRIAIYPNTLQLESKQSGFREISIPSDIHPSPCFIPEDLSYQNELLAPEKRKGGMIVLGTDEGSVFAVNDMTGDVRWKFFASSAVDNAIVAVGDCCYVPTHDGELFCLELKNGTKKWSSDQIQQLVSISENCVYAIDFQNNLIILNKNNGQRIKTLTIPYRTTVLCNGETDRIYLFSADGLIQCLHETQLQTPIIHHPDSYHIAADLAAAVDSKSSAGNDATPARVPQAGDNAGLNNDNSEDEDFQATDNYPDVEPADTENDEEMDEEEDEDIFGTDSDDSPSSAPVPNDGNDEEEEDPFDNL